MPIHITRPIKIYTHLNTTIFYEMAFHACAKSMALMKTIYTHNKIYYDMFNSPHEKPTNRVFIYNNNSYIIFVLLCSTSYLFPRFEPDLESVSSFQNNVGL